MNPSVPPSTMSNYYDSRSSLTLIRQLVKMKTKNWSKGRKNWYKGKKAGLTEENTGLREDKN